MNKEEKKEYMKIYNKQYKIDNKEKIKELNKKRYEGVKNSEEYKKNKIQYQKDYRIKERKKYVISNWINKGIVDNDWDSVYEEYIKQTHCWICNREYDFIKIRRCLDHDHDTGEIRYIVCNPCNIHIIG